MEKKKYDVRDILIAVLKCCLYIGVWLIVSIIITFFISLTITINHASEGEEAIKAIIYSWGIKITLISNIVVIAGYFLFYFLRKSCSFKEKTNIYPVPVKIMGLSVILGFAMQMTTSFVMSCIPFPESWIKKQGEVYADVKQNNLAFITILCVAVVAPVLEELIFRGLVLGRLSRVIPKWGAIVVSALAFGVVHTGPFAMLYTFAFGIFLGWIFTKFKSIVPTIIIHAAYNFTSLILGSARVEFVVLAFIIVSFILLIFITRMQPSINRDEIVNQNEN